MTLLPAKIEGSPAARRRRPPSPAILVALAYVSGACLSAAAVTTAGCSADQAVEVAFDKYHSATSAEYMKYVEADPALDAAAKARRRLSVESAGRVIEGLRQQ